MFDDYLTYVSLVQLATILIGGLTVLVCIFGVFLKSPGPIEFIDQRIWKPLTLLATAVLANFASPISRLRILDWWYDLFNRLQAYETAQDYAAPMGQFGPHSSSLFYLWIRYRNFDQVVHTVCLVVSMIFVVLTIVSLRKTIGGWKKFLRVASSFLLAVQTVSFAAILRNDMF